MTEWPTGWTRREDGADRGDGRGSPGGDNVPGAGDPTVGLPYGPGSAAGSGGAYGPGSAAAGGSAYGAGSAAAASGGAYGAGTRAAPSPWPDQPPMRSLPGQQGPRRARGTVGGRRRRSRLRLILAF